MTKDEVEIAISSIEKSMSSIDTWLLLFTLLVAVGVAGELILGVSHWLKDRELRPLRAEQSRIHATELAQLGTAAAEANARATNSAVEVEKLKLDNLALQTVLLPRHVGLIGLNEEPKAKTYFAGIDRFAGTEVAIQVAPDREAQNLANEIAIVLMKFGWKAQIIDESRSHVRSDFISDGVDVLYATGKPWTKDEPNQPWFAWHDAAEMLADALTKARPAVGEYRVSRAGFQNDPANLSSGLIPYFDPPLTGVYLRVGSRPVAATVDWINRGRPDSTGNPPATPVAPVSK
ncbi:MAG: hypothetical protein ABSA66_19040 [Roseiarcus sp.]|jgi:hypothetical protein